MPLEYSFTGRWMNSPISANASIERQIALHLRAADPHDFAVDEDVFAAREFRIESGAQFQQRGDAPARHDAAGGGLQDSADDLKQRALAAAVRSHETDDFAALHAEGDIAQRPEIGVQRLAAQRDSVRGCGRTASYTADRASRRFERAANYQCSAAYKPEDHSQIAAGIRRPDARHIQTELIAGAKSRQTEAADHVRSRRVRIELHASHRAAPFRFSCKRDARARGRRLAEQRKYPRLIASASTIMFGAAPV